jgi:hypothetical protein
MSVCQKMFDKLSWYFPVKQPSRSKIAKWEVLIELPTVTWAGRQWRQQGGEQEYTNVKVLLL